jgi:hypothetical protein
VVEVNRDEVLDLFILPYQSYDPEPIKVKGDKPILLILTQDYAHHLDLDGLVKGNLSPLATLFYEYLAREDGAFEVVFETNPIASIKEIVEKKLGGVKPAYVLYGYTYHYGILIDHEYMKDNGIKFIYTIGDVECTISNRLAVEILERMKVDYLLNNLESNMNEFTEDFSKIKDVPVLYVPWAIDEKHYPDKGLERDIDVSFVCSFNDGVSYHESRNKIFSILFNLSKSDLNIKLGQFFGDKYIDILNRSKIFVVEPSMRGAMVQKYMEGAACGAMLMGESPKNSGGVFENDVTIVPFDVYNVFKYIKDEDKRKEIAKECQRRVLETYHISKVAKRFEDALCQNSC